MCEYRDIPNHEGYRVGDDGSLWSRRGGIVSEWRKLNSHLLRTGYLRAKIDKKKFYVHRLVLEAFVGPCPHGMVCRHLNGIKTDNRIANLCWGTPAENGADKVRLGEVARGESHGNAKLTDSDVQEIWRLRQAGHSQRELGQMFGVRHCTIGRVIRGLRRNTTDALLPDGMGHNRHTKLSSDDVREIRQLLTIGHKHSELTKRFGVCSASISHISTRRTWKHIA